MIQLPSLSICINFSSLSQFKVWLWQNVWLRCICEEVSSALKCKIFFPRQTEGSQRCSNPLQRQVVQLEDSVKWKCYSWQECVIWPPWSARKSLPSTLLPLIQIWADSLNAPLNCSKMIYWFMGMQSIHPVSFSHTQMSLIEFLTANDRKSYYVLLYCPSACHGNLSVVLRFSSFYCCDAYT